jgi:diadenosine tetraphosphate (Ap4A) HIT family hydrolase
VSLTGGTPLRRGEGGGSRCEICDRYVPRYNENNPYLVAELETGWAVLADNQLYRGYTIFVSKTCVSELHDLGAELRSRFLDEMASVAEAVYRAFSPRKLNYELLGNSVSHLHWHIFPRYEDDPNPRWPVWNNPGFADPARTVELSADEVALLRNALRRAIRRPS